MDRFIRPQAMTKTRSQQLSEKADEQRRRCPFCHQPIDRNNAWKGTADRFYCSEFCADSEPIIPSRQQSLKERFDRQYLARLERLVALRQQQR